MVRIHRTKRWLCDKVSFKLVFWLVLGHHDPGCIFNVSSCHQHYHYVYICRV